MLGSFRVVITGVITLYVGLLGLAAAVPAVASASCPVLYAGSRHTCYVYPTAGTIRQAEEQMPVRVVNPIRTVRRFTSLVLTSVIVDRTRRDTGVLHPWVISYACGNVPDLGLPGSTVPRSARFLVLSEAVGRITLRANGRPIYDTPQFERIRVHARGRAIWHVAVNLPHRNASMIIHSTLPRVILEGLVTALMQQSV